MDKEASMSLRPLMATLRTLDPRAHLRISRDWQSVLRFHFLHAALDSGILQALREPRTREALARGLNIVRPEILDALLDLGISLGELRGRGDRISLRGRRSTALADPRNDALAAMVQANVTYYNDSYRHLTTRLRGAPLGQELEIFGPLVARLSRITEPYIADFIERVLRGRGPVRALDVGCGSGAHLRSLLGADTRNTAVGLDLDPAVVRQALENLRGWDLDHRATVVEGDGGDLPPEVEGDFDVILLLSVVYYLDVPERMELLRMLHARLSPGGVLIAATSCRGPGVDLFSANLNVVTSSTRGLTPLPTIDEIEGQLRGTGFRDVRRTRLIPATSYWGLTAA
jgi:SAM-dependent methyltransferase